MRFGLPLVYTDYDLPWFLNGGNRHSPLAGSGLHHRGNQHSDGAQMPAFSNPKYTSDDLRSARVLNRGNDEKYVPMEDEDDDLLQVKCHLETSPCQLEESTCTILLSVDFDPFSDDRKPSTKCLC